VSCGTIAEFMKNTVSVGLLHLGMNVVTRISEFCDLLGQQFYPIDRVAEDDTLIDLSLEKRVFKQWTFCLSSTYA